jgi:hypothetical protein
MKIPVFVSCPSVLNATQNSARRRILRELERLALEPRALGRTDYPTGFPMREVATIAKHCSGGVILGFEQFHAKSGIWKRGAKEQRKTATPVVFPTQWNQLEAGILFGLRLPLLVFKEPGIEGGIFDNGVTDAFVHLMPQANMSMARKEAFEGVFLKWQAEVREHYYRDD